MKKQSKRSRLMRTDADFITQTDELSTASLQDMLAVINKTVLQSERAQASDKALQLSRAKSRELANNHLAPRRRLKLKAEHLLDLLEGRGVEIETLKTNLAIAF